MKYFIILFLFIFIGGNQFECVKQVKEELGYPRYKAVRYCNGGQM